MYYCARTGRYFFIKTWLRGCRTKIVQYESMMHLIHTMFLCMGGAILFFSFIAEKFYYCDERVSFATAGLEHYNHTILISAALQYYDFSVHGRGDFLKFILRLRKIPLRRWDGVFSSSGVGALKSCNAYSWNTKNCMIFLSMSRVIFCYSDLISKNFVAPRIGWLSRPRDTSTKFLRCVFLEH